MSLKRICRSDLAKGKRVIYYGRKKINRLHQRGISRNLIHTSIIRAFKPHQKIRTFHQRQSAEYMVQCPWTQFRRSASFMGKPGELDFVFFCHKVNIPPIKIEDYAKFISVRCFIAHLIHCFQ